ncbi:MAG: GNAT family N-acetyltransferase [Nevskiaceae bacterium]
MFLFDYFVSPQLPPGFRTTLPSGVPVLVRHVGPADAPRLKDGFKLISSLARRRHFPDDDVKELGPEQLAALQQVDQKGYCIWGALNPARAEEPGIGIARYRRLEEEPSAADVAITILDQYQGTGAGLLLHACLHYTAAHNKIRHFYYDVDAENMRFIRHLEHLGAEYKGRVLGLTRLRMPVYARALSVPQYNSSGFKFSQAMRRVTAGRAAAA